MGYMKWCCFWDTVYDGTIASGIHMLISTVVYFGMCFALYTFGIYYGSDLSSEAAATHRLTRLQQQRMQQTINSITGEFQLQLQQQEPTATATQLEEFRRPLLTPLERDMYVYSALAMMGLNMPILLTSFLLLVGAVLRKPRIMFLWVVSMVPYLIIDSIYHSFLFYTLLVFPDLDALLQYLWFQLWTVMIIMFWVFRCAFDVYAILCVMALRNEILRSGKSKLKNLNDGESGAAESATPLNRSGSKKAGASPAKGAPGSTIAAIAKSGLKPTTSSIFSSGFASGLERDEDEVHKKHLEALHNAAATADTQHQLLLMSAAQHLASSSGLLAPAPNPAVAVTANRQPLMPSVTGTTAATQQHLGVNPGSAHQSQHSLNLIDLGSATGTGTMIMGGDTLNPHPPGLIRQVSEVGSAPGLISRQISEVAFATNNTDRIAGSTICNATGALLAPPSTAPGFPGVIPPGGGLPGFPPSPVQKRQVNGWGMSKYLLKQQQQALAIASGLSKSGFLPPNAPLSLVAQQAAAAEANIGGVADVRGPQGMTAQQQKLMIAPLSGQSKRYAKQMLKMNQQQGDSDFSSQQIIDAI